MSGVQPRTRRWWHIRAKWMRAGGVTFSEIGERFGVSHVAAMNAVRSGPASKKAAKAGIMRRRVARRLAREASQ